MVGVTIFDMLQRRMLVFADYATSNLYSERVRSASTVRRKSQPPDLSRDRLLETLAHREAETFDRAIDNRIMSLRRKVERDPSKPEAIRSVRGVGYMFAPSSD